MNMRKLLKQAQEMQDKMQRDLASTFAEASGTILATESHESLASSVDSEERPEVITSSSLVNTMGKILWVPGSNPVAPSEQGPVRTASGRGASACMRWPARSMSTAIC